MRNFKKFVAANLALLGLESQPRFTLPQNRGITDCSHHNSCVHENFNPFTNGDNIKGLMFEPLLVYNAMVGKIEYRLAESLSMEVI